MVIDDLAIGRILTAVGESFEPAGLDRSELRAAIEDALTGAKIIEKFRAGPRVKTCSKQLGRIHKAANTLLSVLTADDAADLVKSVLPEAIANVSRLTATAESLKETLDESTKDGAAKYPLRVPSVKDWLAGVELPCIYEEYFCRKAKISRNKKTRKLGGPAMRFLRTVLVEIRVPFSDESIARAMTRLAEVRERRRVVRRRERDIGQK